jgi:hypothetical protein
MYFCTWFVAWKYLIMYMYVRKNETGGIWFHFVFERLLGCLAIMVIFTAATIGVKLGTSQV